MNAGVMYHRLALVADAATIAPPPRRAIAGAGRSRVSSHAATSAPMNTDIGTSCAAYPQHLFRGSHDEQGGDHDPTGVLSPVVEADGGSYGRGKAETYSVVAGRGDAQQWPAHRCRRVVLREAQGAGERDCRSCQEEHAHAGRLVQSVVRQAGSREWQADREDRVPKESSCREEGRTEPQQEHPDDRDRRPLRQDGTDQHGDREEHSDDHHSPSVLAMRRKTEDGSWDGTEEQVQAVPDVAEQDDDDGDGRHDRTEGRVAPAPDEVAHALILEAPGPRGGRRRRLWLPTHNPRSSDGPRSRPARDTAQNGVGR